MSKLIADSSGSPTLRQLAHQQLAAGIAPPTRGWGVGVEALSLLHRLASSPASAADALKLLHELQVHQVELDLQQTQLEAIEQDQADELTRYRALFELAPVAHFVLDASGQVAQCNRAGAELLGASVSDVIGRRLDQFLSPDSQLPLAGLLRDVRAGKQKPGCTVRLARSESRHWRVDAAALIEGDAIQLVFHDGPAAVEG